MQGGQLSTLLIIGDPHLKVSNMSNVKLFLEWILSVVASHDIDLVINLGDTQHTHNVVRSEIMTLITEHVKDITSFIPYVILVGNHDMAHHKTPDIHAWIPFMHGYKNLHIVDKLKIIDGISFMPYIDSVIDFQVALDKAMSKSDLIFCHQTFRDANYGFITAKEGSVVPSNYNGLIVSGHVHKTQTLGPVWYPGTPFAQESTDHNETKGIYLLDTLSREVTFIKSPLPQWVTVRATISDYEQVIQGMDKSNKNHLVLVGSSPELKALMDIRNFKELKKEYGFSVKKQVNAESDTAKSTKRTSTLEGAITDYIDNIYKGDVDKDTLKAQCLEALK